MAIKEIKPAGLIAVMGGTGTGKSSLINAIIGKDVTDVGHGLESQTSDIKEYDFLMKNGLRVTLIDTPGFNDYATDTGGKSDLVILKEIGAVLKAKYNEDRKFSGILYLHNICVPKVGGSLQRNMTMFKKLCGPDPLKNVVVVTTFWDEIGLEQGIEIETELKTKDKFFKGLVEGKSKFVRSGKFPPGKIPKGLEFLSPISVVTELVALDPVFVEMQKELAEGKTVEETSAGAELYKELEQLKLQQKKDVIDLNQKIAEMKAQNIKDRLAREALENESQALKDRIKEWEARQHELHLAVRSGRSEWVSAIAQLKQEKETSAKVRLQSMITGAFVKVTQQRDLELESSRQAELRSEIELLKTLHAKEILECQFQIRSLLDGNSMDAFKKKQLENTCDDLKATVSDLSLSLIRLRDMNEREAVERIDVMRQYKRDAETANRLLESQHRHGQSLEAKIRQQTADLSALREQLHREEANNSQANQLLDVRTAELKGAQVFLTKADSYAGADLIKMVESLNSKVFQGAALMSEGLEFDEAAWRNARLNTQAMERAEILLGSAMFSQLLAKPPTVDPLPLQLALQSIMILRCIQIIQTLCPLEYRNHNDFLKKIYAGIRASEEQAVAGRWRAMTQAQLRPSRSYAPHIAEDLVNVFTVCGLSKSNSKYQIIIQDIKHRILVLEKAALQLKVALEGVTSVDIEPFCIPTGAQFDPTNMDDAYEDSTRNPEDGERIMCTTDMGLRRALTKRSVDGQVQSYDDVILKPKVVLASSLTDEAEANALQGAI